MASKLDFMSIDVHEEDVQKMLDGAIRRLGNTGEALAEVAVMVLANNEKNWGKGWKKAAPSTMEQKEKEGEPELEVKTGALKRAMTQPGAEGQVHEITPTSLKLGVDLWYAHFQKGTKHQPRRTMMRMTPTVRKEIQHVIQEKIMP